MTRSAPWLALALAPAALVLGGSAPLPEPLTVMNNPAYEDPAQRWTSVEQPAAALGCEHRIEQARASAGKPPLERAPADASKPILHYAVDHRIDGCPVLIPVGDREGVLPPPAPSPGPLLIPAN